MGQTDQRVVDALLSVADGQIIDEEDIIDLCYNHRTLAIKVYLILSSSFAFGGSGT